jgi:hypothetical protein
MTRLDEPTSPQPEGAPGQPEQLLATPPAAEFGVQRRPVEPDAVCAGAVGPARTAAEGVAGPAEVGDHLGVLAEGERLVTHYFRCLAKGYRGWRWAITVARAPRSRTASVCETVLLPGDDAVLAPAWVPWSDRLAPGDLGPADVLPYREDDPLLQPGYQQTGDEEADRVALWELGLGRARVLGPLGRDEAATRWYRGDRGPTADEAVHAAAACSTCGYFLPLVGALRQAFGVCANEWSPSDARVVSVDHGCGAHSETDVERPEPMPLPEPILDETGAEAIALPPRTTESLETTATTATTATTESLVASESIVVDEADSTGTGDDSTGTDDDSTGTDDDSTGTDDDSTGAGEGEGGGEAEADPDGDRQGAGAADQAGVADQGAGAPNEGGDAPLLVGDGIAQLPLTALQLTPPIDVGPAVEALPAEIVTPVDGIPVEEEHPGHRPGGAGDEPES